MKDRFWFIFTMLNAVFAFPLFGLVYEDIMRDGHSWVWFPFLLLVLFVFDFYLLNEYYSQKTSNKSEDKEC